MREREAHRESERLVGQTDSTKRRMAQLAGWEGRGLSESGHMRTVLTGQADCTNDSSSLFASALPPVGTIMNMHARLHGQALQEVKHIIETKGNVNAVDKV